MIKTIEEAHAEVIKNISRRDVSSALILLEQCQQAAIAIGDVVENSEGADTPAVRKLEEYCETLYEVNENIRKSDTVNSLKIEKLLRKSINAAQSYISSIEERVEVVFLPYKASMWDSLESVWMVAEEEPTCDAYVIPIPYYDKNPDGSLGNSNYEAEKFPDNIPITNFQEYNLEERHPDAIFIHNPYDQYNYVTSVHPFFYSSNLRNMTDCLVYIPYYATSGKMADGQSFCSAYENVDYIIVQSRDMMEQFDERIPREKLLPLGSPKFDRVIRLCENPPKPPEDWEEKIEGRKVFFYNTSISAMLQDTDDFLKKLQYVFDCFRRNTNTCILWRPHPLLESTFESMRPFHRLEYERIKKNFIDEDYGIFDTTPDIGVSIALCDAYIGDGSSSVVSLFEIAGKPVYLMNNRLTSEPKEDDWKGYIYKPISSDEVQNKFFIGQGNQLYKDVTGKYDYKWFCELPDGIDTYIAAIAWKDKIICVPRCAYKVLVIDNKDKSIYEIRLEDNNRHSDLSFIGGGIIGDYLFLFPNLHNVMVRINLNNGEKVYIDGIGDYCIGRTDEGVIIPAGKTIWCDKLMLSRSDGNEVLIIDPESLQIERKEICVGGLSTTLICQEDKNEVWFMPYEGTVVTAWNTYLDTYNRYNLHIDGLKAIDRATHMECNHQIFSSFAVTAEGKYIFSPYLGNKFVILDRSANKISEWIPPIDIETDDVSPYMPNFGIGAFGIRMGDSNKCIYNYYPKREGYIFDLVTEEMKPLNINFDKDEVFSKANGFVENSNGTMYYCNEDVFNPLPSIIDDKIIGNVYDSKKCAEVCAKWNASPKGDCGNQILNKILELL